MTVIQCGLSTIGHVVVMRGKVSQCTLRWTRHNVAKIFLRMAAVVCAITHAFSDISRTTFDLPGASSRGWTSTLVAEQRKLFWVFRPPYLCGRPCQGDNGSVGERVRDRARVAFHDHSHMSLCCFRRCFGVRISAFLPGSCTHVLDRRVGSRNDMIWAYKASPE